MRLIRRLLSEDVVPPGDPAGSERVLVSQLTFLAEHRGVSHAGQSQPSHHHKGIKCSSPLPQRIIVRRNALKT